MSSNYTVHIRRVDNDWIAVERALTVVELDPARDLAVAQLTPVGAPVSDWSRCVALGVGTEGYQGAEYARMPRWSATAGHGSDLPLVPIQTPEIAALNSQLGYAKSRSQILWGVLFPDAAGFDGVRFSTLSGGGGLAETRDTPGWSGVPILVGSRLVAIVAIGLAEPGHVLAVPVRGIAATGTQGIPLVAPRVLDAAESRLLSPELPLASVVLAPRITCSALARAVAQLDNYAQEAWLVEHLPLNSPSSPPAIAVDPVPEAQLEVALADASCGSSRGDVVAALRMASRALRARRAIAGLRWALEAAVLAAVDPRRGRSSRDLFFSGSMDTLDLQQALRDPAAAQNGACGATGWLALQSGRGRTTLVSPLERALLCAYEPGNASATLGVSLDSASPDRVFAALRRVQVDGRGLTEAAWTGLRETPELATARSRPMVQLATDLRAQTALWRRAVELDLVDPLRAMALGAGVQEASLVAVLSGTRGLPDSFVEDLLTDSATHALSDEGVAAAVTGTRASWAGGGTDMHDYVSRGVSPVEIDAVEHARLVARRGIVQASARMLAGEPNALSVADQLLALEDSLGDLFTALLERGARL